MNDKQYSNNDEGAATGVQLKGKSRAFVFMGLVDVDRDVVNDLGKSSPCIAL